ncbi:hypothetical protein F1640_18405 [Novosphingobium sp. NBM11]|uniref:putative metallopeptidase n=1 Tax=Novosphingobium sp. NBM11 TaxID=2596914 RepID=UPI0018921599|nr:putative metallopeptidase [Novosphingobium sp. NBM11]MBF5091928.1 hypothetical protein [Novosphingobium sp. NBM11]
MIRHPTPPELQLNGAFAPDQTGLGEWARTCFIEDGNPLTNPEHRHLQAARIGWLWTNYDARSVGRAIAGEASMPRSGSRWGQQRAMFQLEEWFGMIPDFIITISAPIAQTLDDASFCALIEHELFHCAQALDEFGVPRFTREGLPVFALRGHDVEQFVGVVRRYGSHAAGVSELVHAALVGPTVQDGAVEAACGSCLRRAA